MLKPRRPRYHAPKSASPHWRAPKPKSPETRGMNPHAEEFAPQLSRSAEDAVSPPLPPVPVAFLLPRLTAPPPADDGWEERALEFEAVLTKALLATGCAHLLAVDAIQADDMMSRYSDEKLWLCAAVLGRLAPRPESGYTRYHRLAACAADHLERRGMRIV
jgi:hypothetical protein